MVHSMLSLALIFSNQFLQNPNQGSNDSLVSCITACHRSTSCASFFYNFDEGLCYQSFYLYSLVKYGETLVSTSDNVKYFEWTLGSCNETGWKFHRPTKSCFIYIDDGRKHHEAISDCQAMNAVLIKADTDLRVQFINHFGLTYGKDIWTSGQLISSQWYWSSNQQFGDYSNWTPDHPKSGDECVLIKKELAAWFSDNCDSSERFMCEMFDVNSDYCSLNVNAVLY